jgi:hypothetical protein
MVKFNKKMFSQIIKTMKKLLVISAFCIGIVSVTTAQHTPAIKHQQKHQTTRINHGIRNGELTGPEAKRLVREQKHILHEKRLAKVDGTVTRRERRHIRRDQRIASRDIYRQKHDKQDRN